MRRATSVRITGATTIECHFFYGAVCEPTATLTVDRGGAVAVANRIVELAAGGSFLPNFAIATELDTDGAAQKSRIHCVPGVVGVTIFYST